MFGRRGHLAANIAIGLPHLGHDMNTHAFKAEPKVNLQLASEIAQRNLAEQSDKQRPVNQTLGSRQVFKPSLDVLLCKPHHSTDRPKLKLSTHGTDPTRSGHSCRRLSPGSDRPHVTAETSRSILLIFSRTANKRSCRALILPTWTLRSSPNLFVSRCYSRTQARYAVLSPR